MRNKAIFPNMLFEPTTTAPLISNSVVVVRMAFTNPKKSSAYVLTPNGSSIAKDESNIGQKMLTKMGWMPETGLGKEGNGILDPVKANCNLGRKGFGKCPTQSSTGMIQQLAFNSILQSLSKHKTQNESRPKTKLEDKSKKSRSRVHYGKFVRAKDVSQYSKESLKIVLGQSHDGDSAASEDADGTSSAPEDTSTCNTTIKSEFGVKTYSSTIDLKSYFSMKRKALESPDCETLLKVKPEPSAVSSDDERPCFSASTTFSQPSGVDFNIINEVSRDEEIVVKEEPFVETYTETSDPCENFLPPLNMHPKSGHRQSSAFATSNLHSLAGYRYY